MSIPPARRWPLWAPVLSAALLLGACASQPATAPARPHGQMPGTNALRRERGKPG